MGKGQNVTLVLGLHIGSIQVTWLTVYTGHMDRCEFTRRTSLASCLRHRLYSRAPLKTPTLFELESVSCHVLCNIGIWPK